VGHPTKRILIADDHESVLRGVRAMLEAHPGWEVCGEAVNGYEAITKAIVSWLSVKWRSDVLR
jgi:DNA-binding NarL/FixJ family response regulator